VSTDAPWPFDIGIVGTGIVGSHQITRESEEVIRRSKRTFLIESGYGISDYLKALCPNITSLGPLYERGRDRLLTYRKMAAEVIAAAVADSPVCLAAYGHPWIYCYPTTLITRAAPLLKLRVSVFPGISAFDTLLVDLGVDIGPNGVQMYEATDLLLRCRPIQNDVTCIIWQPTIVGDPTYPAEPSRAEQFKPLQEYLLGFYPIEHEVALVTTRTHPLTRSVVRRFQLSELTTELVKAPPVATLYIAPLSERPIEDTALLQTMLTTGLEESERPPALHDAGAAGTPA
jgi:precorrin-3B methylase